MQDGASHASAAGRCVVGAGTVSETGFGPIVVGMTPLEARTAAGGRLQLPERLGAEGCDYAAVPGKAWKG